MMVPLRERGLLSGDTSREAEARQIEVWRSLSTIEIAQLVDGASETVRTFALAGLRDRYPTATEPELVARLALITLGPDLARSVYPELNSLEP